MGRPIFLFDVDGTLTPPRQKIHKDVADFLKSVRTKFPLAVVGGSDLVKIVQQLGDSQEEVLNNFDYVFAENGVVGYKGQTKLDDVSIHSAVGEEKLQKFINHCLRYLSEITLPCKRGTFVEFRNAMLNVSPIGRSCSQAERDQFAEYDEIHNIRSKFVANLRENFPVQEYGLQFSIGGQISVDVFPIGWDKTFCLKYLIQDGFDKIHFFGDRTGPGGNDHEVYSDPRTVGHVVTSPEDMVEQVRLLTKQLGLR